MKLKAIPRNEFIHSAASRDERTIDFSPKNQQASWLKNNYEDDVWEIADAGLSFQNRQYKIPFNVVVDDPARKNEICRLSDPVYRELLETIKTQVFGLRTGRFATVTSAAVHMDMASAVVNWASWMILNNIKSFSSLTQADFKDYLEAAVYGPGHLLRYSSRLTEYVKKHRAAGKEIPFTAVSNARPILNASALLTLAGIEPGRGWRDKATAYALLKIAYEENFYLTPRQMEKLSENPPEIKRLVNIPLLRMLQPWDYQWRMRSLFSGDSIKFNAFEDVTPDRVAIEMGEAKNRTKTAPVRQTMQLIDRSLRWVLDYSPVLFQLRSQFEEICTQTENKDLRSLKMKKVVERTNLPEGPGSFKQLGASTKKIADGISFGTALLEFLPMACFVVIAAFTARRLEEVLSIRAAGKDNEDCLSSDDNGYYLETYIEKTVRDWEKLPCNEAVVAAVEVLRMWSEPARTLSGDVKLFRYKNLTSSEVPLFKPGRSLQKFTEFLSLSLTEDGKQWEFKPHQFRRFFAIMYFWRFEYGNLSALGQHLRHFNTEMTQVYVTEVETGEIFKHVGREFTTTILSEAARGKRNVSGPFGEKFKEKFKHLMEKHRRQTKVVSPKLINDTVERFVDMSNRRLKGFKWGYCACGTGPQQLANARCLQTDENAATAIEPNLSNSSPVVCGDCPHHLTNEAFRDFWKEEVEMHERAAADPKNGNLLREASRRRAETLKRQYERSFIKSEILREVIDNE